MPAYQQRAKLETYCYSRMNNALDLHQKLQALSQCYCKSFYLQASQFRKKTTPTEMVPQCQRMKDLFFFFPPSEIFCDLLKNDIMLRVL